MSIVSRVAKAWTVKMAGDVIQFPVPPKKILPKVPTVRIAGKTYRLSNIAGHMYFFGETPGDPPNSPGARIIKSPPRFNYLWVVEKPSDMITMWVFSEGNEKLHNKLHSFPRAFIEKLDEAGALNEVSRAERESIERAMRRKYEKLMKSLKESIHQNDPLYARAAAMAKTMFREVVLPEYRKRMTEYQRGAIPIGFRVSPQSAFPEDRQVASHIFGEATRRHFTPEKILAYLQAKGLPVDDLDSQDPDFIMHEIIADEGARVLPRIRG